MAARWVRPAAVGSPAALRTRRSALRTLGFGTLAVLSASLPVFRARDTQGPSPTHLPRWRGFNLVEKATLGNNQPYREADFDLIAKWGFNFVRLPVDYQIWTERPDAYREQPLREIDHAIGWGLARGIHVNLCLHRAPGYSVNPPAEPLDLWGEGPGAEEARRQFVGQWRMLARRYRGIPLDALSFNLVNEPPAISPATYLRAIGPAVAAIRMEQPGRLIIVDGLTSAQKPVPELVRLAVAQSIHGYAPLPLTHFRAEWVEGSDRFARPTWPLAASINSYVYGDAFPELRLPLVIAGHYAAGTRVSVTVGKVSRRADLVVSAGRAKILEHSFQPDAGVGEWRSSAFVPQFGIYQAVYERAYEATIPEATTELRLELTQGDWLTVSEIHVSPYDRAASRELVLIPSDNTFAVKQESFTLDAAGTPHADSGRLQSSQALLLEQQVVPFKGVEAMGSGVHVGEFGVYSYTPHDVSLAWMKDVLANWRTAGWGWALWNLRGAFGPLDSGRADVRYETIDGGLKLDRAMLELLQQG